MKRINPNIYPKGGYCFTDSDGTKHVADTWSGVIKRVIRYRRRRGQPEGNVSEEVVNQACQKNPGLCSEETEAYRAQVKQVSLKGSVLLWLNRIRQRKEKEPLTFVSDQLHAARVDVCSRCAKNTGLPEGCGSCRAALKELAESIVGRRQLDARVNACGVLGEYLPVSSWFEDVALPNPDLPWECWRKRTL